MKFSYALLALIIVSSVIIFFRLGSNSLHNGDEARYALITKEMMDSGDWLTPHFLEKPYYRKPPLRFWMTIPLFSLLGYTEFAARFWSALAAVGCIAFTALLGRRLFGSKEGIFAGFILLTCMQFLYEHCAKTGEMDSITLFYLVSSVYFVVASNDRPGYIIVSSILMGLSSLTKNFAGLISFGIVLPYLWISGRWRRFTRSQILTSAVILLILSFSWIITMIAIHGRDFIQSYFWDQTVNRMLDEDYRVGLNEAQSFTGSVEFLITTIFRGFFPWSLLVVPALIWMFFHLKDWWKENQVLLIWWAVTFLIGLAFFKNKYYWYIIPVYPVFAILVAAFLFSQFINADSFYKRVGILAIVIAGLFMMHPNTAYSPFTEHATLIGVLTIKPAKSWLQTGIAGAVCFVLFTLFAKKFPKAASVAACALLAIYAAVFAFLPLQRASYQSAISEVRNLISVHATQTENRLLLWKPLSTMTIEGRRKPVIVKQWYLRSVPRTRVQEIGTDPKTVNQALNSPEKGTLILLPEEYLGEITARHRFLGRRSMENGRKVALIAPPL